MLDAKKEFAARYCSILGNMDGLTNRADQPKAVRVNTGKISKERFAKIAQANLWQLDRIAWNPEAFLVIDNPDYPLSSSIEYFAGLFYIQEPSSMLPPLVLDPKPHDLVLDMTAAPGSKTTQLAGLMGDQGLLVANDKNVKRIKALSFNLEKHGCLSTLLTTLDAKRFGNLYPETFNKVLLDAPCSAEGSVCKDPKFFQYWNPNKIGHLARLQKTLLTAALKTCKTGGTIVYSTCTIAPEENEANIQWLLDNYGDQIELVAIDQFDSGLNSKIGSWQGQKFSEQIGKTLRVLPSRDNWESFFVAKLIKTRSFDRTKQVDQQPKTNRLVLASGPKRNLIVSTLGSRFGIDPKGWDGLEFSLIKDSIWLLGKQAATSYLTKNLPWERAGIPLGRFVPQGIRFSHPFCLEFGHLANTNAVELTKQEALRLIRGQNINLSDVQSATPGQVIIKYDGMVLGRALLQDHGKIKNQFPPSYIVKNVY